MQIAAIIGWILLIFVINLGPKSAVDAFLSTLYALFFIAMTCGVLIGIVSGVYSKLHVPFISGSSIFFILILPYILVALRILWLYKHPHPPRAEKMMPEDLS